MQLYLDLDGVLADFDGQLKRYGVERNDKTFIHKPKSEWTKEQTELSDRVEKAMKSPEFWSDMPVTFDGYKLWDFCKKFNPIILTAAPSHLPKQFDMIADAKLAWCQNYLGVDETDVVVCLRHEKADFAGYHNILVDDTQANIDDWKNENGIGIFHETANDSIKYIELYTSIIDNITRLEEILVA